MTMDGFGDHAARDHGFGYHAARDQGFGFHGCAWPWVWFLWPRTVKCLVALAARGYGFDCVGSVRP